MARSSKLGGGYERKLFGSGNFLTAQSTVTLFQKALTEKGGFATSNALSEHRTFGFPQPSVSDSLQKVLRSSKNSE